MYKIEPFRILLVDAGNTCRSPIAAGVLREMSRSSGLDHHIQVESAGTDVSQPGEPADPRAQAAASKRNYDISAHVSRQVTKEDFPRFDLILGMDWDNHAALQQMSGRQHHHKIKLLMSFASEHESAVVPDPYYGNPEAFDSAIESITDAVNNLIDFVRRRMAQKAAA